MVVNSINIPLTIWRKLIRELKKKGEGYHESGAFLLATAGSNTVSHFICYDELDPSAFDTGIIVLNGDAFIPLWNYCREHACKVVADVHTHPGAWTSQSSSDKEHPMIAQPGHVALIVPHFAKKSSQLLNGVGAHVFLGNRKWLECKSATDIIKLIK